MASSFKIYNLLLNHFGSQGWWPTTPAGKKEPIYHLIPRINGLTESEKFEICIGAILTQNTAWSNVVKALGQLHERKLLSPQKIKKVPVELLEKKIRSSGYFRQKAKKLKIFSEYLLRKYDGKMASLLEQSTQKIRSELLTLFGLGPETVDSMLLYAGSHPVFVVDAYTKRIGNRVGLFNTDQYDEVQKYFHKTLKKSVALYNEYHALLVALGKNFCKTKPVCGTCPLIKICENGKSEKN